MTKEATVPERTDMQEGRPSFGPYYLMLPAGYILPLGEAAASTEIVHCKTLGEDMTWQTQHISA